MPSQRLCLRLRPLAQMAFENSFHLLLMLTGYRDAWRRREGEQAPYVQAQHGLRWTDRENNQPPGFRKTLPLVALDIEPGNQPAVLNKPSFPHLEKRKNDMP